MVDVNVNSMPPKVIGKEARLRTRGPFGLSKNLGPKRCPNIWRRKEFFKINDPVKVENGGVRHKKYNGCCMKQWIKIPTTTWTSPILRRRSTCQTSFNKAFFMKDDVKVKVPNRTPKILIPSDGVLKSSGRPKNDHTIHFWGWMEKPIPQSSIWKCSNVDDTIEKGPMCECHLQWIEINKRKND